MNLVVNNNNICVSKQKPLYERPTDWLFIEDLNETDEKIVGLYGIFSGNTNYASFNIVGDYTVDWGDGIIENFNSLDQATHQYDFNSISNTTLTYDGYKQVIISITPQLGSNITSIYLSSSHPIFSGVPYSSTWLEIKFACKNITSDQFSLSSSNVSHKYLKALIFQGKKNSQITTSMSGFFQNGYDLEYVKLPTIKSNFFSSTFNGCFNLKEIDSTFETTSVTNTTNMFRQCYSLQSVPNVFFNEGNTIGSVNLTFNGCPSITNIDISKPILGLSGAFVLFLSSGMRSLIDPPKINFSGISSVNYQFTSSGIQYLTDDYIFGNTWFSIFNGCHNIMVINDSTVSGVTNFSNAFTNTVSNLLKCSVKSINANINFSNKRLGRNEIVEIFNNLTDRTLTTSANIDISSCYGAFYLTASDRLIATNKNWTITG